jgi:hypothetical protein
MNEELKRMWKERITAQHLHLTEGNDENKASRYSSRGSNQASPDYNAEVLLLVPIVNNLASLQQLLPLLLHNIQMGNSGITEISVSMGPQLMKYTVSIIKNNNLN